jgi:two-component system chemotaxis sensor kinase CheA
VVGVLVTASFRDDTSLRDFAEEAREHIITLNKDFLELEDRGRDTPLEIINEAFRAIHTIKGLSGMLGLSSINQLSHGMEDAMSAVRQGEVPLAGEFAQALFEGVDLLSSMVAAAGRGDAAEADLGPALDAIASSLERARSSVEATPAGIPAGM